MVWGRADGVLAAPFFGDDRNATGRKLVQIKRYYWWLARGGLIWAISKVNLLHYLV